MAAPPKAPKILRTAAEARAFAEVARGRGGLALVPTMGFLHDGHLSLIREGKIRAATVVATLFVNPTQFGPKEDLSRYPRDFEGDVAKCASAGADAVFAPENAEMYPEGAQTWVEVTEVSQGLCGERRPGHFKGVATIVAKLFAIFHPHVALFGEKDYQQLLVLKALNRDLLFGIDVIGMPTIREQDGLAMSSRNAYLSVEDRGRALAISRGLFAAQAKLEAGTREASGLVSLVRAELQAASIREDYVEVVDATTLRRVDRIEPGKAARMLVAGFLGTTRLIDNVPMIVGSNV